MFGKRLSHFRRAPSYDPGDPVERKIAELQVQTGAHFSLRRSRVGGGWEARVNGRQWRMGSRPQLMMEVLEHLSELARSTVETAVDTNLDSADDSAQLPGGDVVVDLMERRTANRSNHESANPLSGLAGPVEETGP